MFARQWCVRETKAARWMTRRSRRCGRAPVESGVAFREGGRVAEDGARHGVRVAGRPGTADRRRISGWVAHRNARATATRIVPVVSVTPRRDHLGRAGHLPPHPPHRGDHLGHPDLGGHRGRRDRVRRARLCRARISAIASRAGVNQQLISYYFDGEGLVPGAATRLRRADPGGTGRGPPARDGRDHRLLAQVGAPSNGTPGIEPDEWSHLMH
jgi:hypothetical protein